MENRKKTIGRFNIRYDWIIKNIRLNFFIAILIVIYIYNGHNADNTIRQINKLNREIKILKNEFKITKAEVLFITEENQILNAVQKNGLIENNETPLILKINKDSLK